MRDSLKTRQSATLEAGRSLAVSGLAFIAADSDRLSRFLNLTGLGPHNLRTAAADPAFLDSVLDYLVGDEHAFARLRRRRRPETRGGRPGACRAPRPGRGVKRGWIRPGCGFAATV